MISKPQNTQKRLLNKKDICDIEMITSGLFRENAYFEVN